MIKTRRIDGAKFAIDQILKLTKRDGEAVAVRVEGISINKRFEHPIYDVREVESRIGYPASENELKEKR